MENDSRGQPVVPPLATNSGKLSTIYGFVYNCGLLLLAPDPS